jgi:hypothetical protein
MQMTIQVHLAPETERVLKARAAQTGRTLEAYLEEIADREAGVLGKAQGDLLEFEHGLDELSEGLASLPTLPSDFSRTDIYGEDA